MPGITGNNILYYPEVEKFLNNEDLQIKTLADSTKDGSKKTQSSSFLEQQKTKDEEAKHKHKRKKQLKLKYGVGKNQVLEIPSVTTSFECQ